MVEQYNCLMERKQKTTLWILIVIGVIWFAAMIPANLTGAETPEMLEVFEVDEYAQYLHVIRMITPGETLYGTFRNFLIYLHYYYGYPFYFWSALSILPFKTAATRVIVCVLRQMISVLPMILSAGLLTWVGTKFRKILPSVLLFLFLLTMPAVLINNFWWHPDSLSLFFISLTFFFLDRDERHCGKNFLFAAAACGAATGTKYLGLYFCLAIPVYLLCCGLSVKEFFRKAGLFLLVMAAAILISDPLLLLPQERAEIIRTMKTQMELSGVGIVLKYENPFWENGGLPSYITDNYASGLCLALGLIALFYGILRGNRTNSLIILAYLVPAFLINTNAAARRLHDFLPILLPFFAMLPNLWNRKALTIASCLLIALQTGRNLHTDCSLYREQLAREENSASIALYKETVEKVLPETDVPAERMTRVWRDWKMYYPEQEGFVIFTDWEMATAEKIAEANPDLILLERANIKAYGSEESLQNAVDSNEYQPIHEFYAAAGNDAIKGYHRVLENSAGSVFMREQ